MEKITTIISIVQTFIMLSSAGILISQLSSQNRWNRKKASQDLIYELHKGDMLEISKEFDRLVPNEKFYNSTYAKFIKELSSEEEKEKIKKVLRIYLNYFEGIAIGIKNGIHAEGLLYDYIGFRLPTIVKWAKGYIEEQRKLAGNSTIYQEVEKVAEKWEKLLEREKEI